MRVLGFGDNIVDRFLDRGLDYPGGNCVNVAVFARRLGSGCRVPRRLRRRRCRRVPARLDRRRGRRRVAEPSARRGERDLHPARGGGGAHVPRLERRWRHGTVAARARRRPARLRRGLRPGAFECVLAQRARTAEAVRRACARLVRPLQRGRVPLARLSRPHLPVGRSRAAVVLAPQCRRDAGAARRRGRTRGIRRARNPRHRRRDRHRRPGRRSTASPTSSPTRRRSSTRWGAATRSWRGSSSRCSVRVGAARLRPIARDSPRHSLRGRMPRTRSASWRAHSAAADLPANPSPLACGESGRADERSARRYGD